MKDKNWINGIKGISISAIILTHCYNNELEGLPAMICSFGKHGVQMFFILSAYLTFTSLNRHLGEIQLEKERKKERKKEREKLLFWYIKKYVRLAPLFYIAIIIYSVFTGGNSFWLGDLKNITIGNIVSHLTFTQGFFPHYINSILGVEWYIGVLSIFYLFSPILYKLINNSSKAVYFVISSVIISYGYEFIVNKFIDISNESYIYNTYFYNFSLIAQLPVFAVGVLFYYLENNDSIRQFTTQKYSSVFIIIISLFLLLGIVVNETNIYGISSVTLISIVFYMLLNTEFIKKSFIINNPIFNYLGKYSFPIYLFHMLLISFYNDYINFYIGNKYIDTLIILLFTVVSSAVIAFPLVRFIEKPISNILINNLAKITHSR